MPHDHDVDTSGYESIVSKMHADLNRSDRERQIERALGASMPKVLYNSLHASDGAKRPAMRSINDRLREAEEYDDDTHGVISPNTFYSLCDRYEGRLHDVL